LLGATCTMVSSLYTFSPVHISFVSTIASASLMPSELYPNWSTIDTQH
jgi:hypothetical protein